MRSLVPVDPAVSEIVAVLEKMDGVVGVALGGSRAAGTADHHSDWDLGVYYRSGLDFEPLTAFGDVHPPGAWGRIMNGGAWLRHRDVRVDVVFRDIDVVDYWTARAADGDYEVDGLLGYLAGIPTYTLAAELAVNEVLAGTPPRATAFPTALAESATRRWRFHARFTLEHAQMRARRGDVAATLGHLGRATIEAAHAVMCERQRWVLNEKGLIERADLALVHRLIANRELRDDTLMGCVEEVGAALGI